MARKSRKLDPLAERRRRMTAQVVGTGLLAVVALVLCLLAVRR